MFSLASSAQRRSLNQNDRWHHRRIGDPLGRGSFGEVDKIVNLHIGEYYAVKTLHAPPAYSSAEDWKRVVLEEVIVLNSLCRVNITLVYRAFPDIA